jgi:hypothetical protein
MHQNRDALVRDVYAHFGLALYNAQVPEHGLANAMMYASKAAGRLPSVAYLDAFLEEKFERTLGGLIKDLRGHIQVDASLEAALSLALKKRNWLAHRHTLLQGAGTDIHERSRLPNDDF